MKIKYKGHKGQMPVHFPIGKGNRSKSLCIEVRMANPYLELSEEDAVALVNLDPQNFEIVEEAKPEVEDVPKVSKKSVK